LNRSGGSIVCALQDARRGEFYTAAFAVRDGRPVRLTPDRALAGEAITAELAALMEADAPNAPPLLVGDGAAAFTDRWAAEIPCVLAPTPCVLALGVAEAARGMDLVAAGELAPVYLRKSQAEREWEARRE